MERKNLLDRLQQSRLLTDEQLTAAAARLEGGDSAEVLFDSLTDLGLLTPYHVKRIRAGKGQGLVLGQYRILDELGRGGFGHVYKALHTVMDRIVAIKVIAPELVEEERARTWFKREVLAITQLCHPNIVMAYDANEAAETLFLVMEYVAGHNLEALVRLQGPLPIALACEMMRQAAQALQYAHEKGIVHRDIKPGNMLIPSTALEQLATCPAGGVLPVVLKVVDFGLARLHHSTRSATLQLRNEKSLLGTPDYISPEQAQNVHAVDIRSDLYSLGCSFYHALTGRRPFAAKTILETVVKHLNEEARPLEQVRPEAPAALCAVVRRLMEKDPARRFQTPAELIAELNFLCGQNTASPAKGRTPVRPLLRPALREAASSPRVPAALVPTAVVPYLAREGFSTDTERARAKPELAYADLPQTAVTPAPDCPPTVPGLALLKGGCVATPPATEEKAAPTDGAAQVARSPLSAAERKRLDAELRNAWQRWTAVVGAFARGQHGTRVSEEGYRTLHTGLLEVCRAQAESADGVRRAAFERLTSIAEPWLTPHNLATADQEALTGLWQQCRHIEQELGVSRIGNLWGWATLAAVVAVTLFLGWQLYQTQRAAGTSAFTWATLKRVVLANPVRWTLLALPAVVLGSIAFLVRRLRL